MKRVVLLVLTCFIAASGAAQNKTYDLPLKPENIEWGYYDGSVKPALRVASGDTIRVETMVARGVERLKAAGLKDEEIPASLKAVEAGVSVRGPGAHPLTGHMYVYGTQPGDM